MRITRILFVGSCAAALAVACGGSSTGGSDTGDGGGSGSSSGGSSSGSGSSSSSSGGSSGGDDATTSFDTGIPGLTQSCASSQDCTGGDVCCGTIGMASATIACAASCSGTGAFQLCASETECADGDTCTAIPMVGSICRPPRMGGDAGPVRRRDGGGGFMRDGGEAADTGAGADTGAE